MPSGKLGVEHPAATSARPAGGRVRTPGGHRHSPHAAGRRMVSYRHAARPDHVTGIGEQANLSNSSERTYRPSSPTHAACGMTPQRHFRCQPHVAGCEDLVRALPGARTCAPSRSSGRRLWYPSRRSLAWRAVRPMVGPVTSGVGFVLFSWVHLPISYRLPSLQVKAQRSPLFGPSKPNWCASPSMASRFPVGAGRRSAPVR
jgi:hypothetical protein